MRRTHIAVLLILLSPAAAYSQRATSLCAGQPADPAPGDEVVITVCNRARGMAPRPQPRLFFCLYRSGRLEYEVPARLDGGSPGLTLKEVKIPASDVEEFIRLGQAEDFRDASPLYPRHRIWGDTSLETTLLFGAGGPSKKIVVNNFSPDDAKGNERFPASLLAMLRKVWELRPPDH